eukprot:9170221-Pyramimonas_sp.AAC.1
MPRLLSRRTTTSTPISAVTFSTCSRGATSSCSSTLAGPLAGTRLGELLSDLPVVGQQAPPLGTRGSALWSGRAVSLSSARYSGM